MAMCRKAPARRSRSRAISAKCSITTLDWKTAERIREDWGGTFCLKGVMSVGDARRAVEIGADAIMISNHGGRQLDGSRSPFDQVRRNRRCGRRPDRDHLRWRRAARHACAQGAGRRGDCASGGRLYLYALAAAGQAGVERAIELLKDEIERDMRLMGVKSVD